jgi:tripeptide aminopeptidase
MLLGALGGLWCIAIPNEVWIEVDLRSAAPEELAHLEARSLAIIEQAADSDHVDKRIRSWNDAKVTQSLRFSVL